MSSDSESKIKIAGVLFDFEGTLVDFQWQLEAAHKEALKAMSLAGLGADFFGPNPDYAVIFNLAADLVGSNGKSRVDSSLLTTVHHIYDRYDADALTRWSLYPHTADVLDILSQAGCQLGVVSSIGHKSLIKALHKLDIADFFHTVISRNDVNRIKPHPEGLLRAAKDFQLEPKELLFVGDSIKDVHAAHAAGMGACHLDGGEDPQSKTASSLPEYNISAIEMLPELVGISAI